jgi:predicted outer membrane repeat protein
MKSIHFWIASVAITCAVRHACADTYIVPGDYFTIQAAIDAASHFDEIMVLPGIYPEAINLQGKSLYLYSEFGPDVTVIDATGIDSSTITCSSGEGPQTIIEGFTVTGGTLDEWPYGGGMINYDSSPTVYNCVFTLNNTHGMVNTEFAAPTIIECTFSENTRSGMSNHYEAQPFVLGCIFLENGEDGVDTRIDAWAQLIACTMKGNGDWGIGNYYPGGETLATNCTIEGNRGGITHDEAFGTYIDCTIVRNTDAGGCVNYEGITYFYNCQFLGNHSNNVGGGATSGTTPAYYSHNFINCTFVGNTADNSGGGIYITGTLYAKTQRGLPPAGTWLTNCTFAMNMAGTQGGAVHADGYGTGGDIHNSILWFNWAPVGPQLACTGFDEFIPLNTIVQHTLVNGGLNAIHFGPYAGITWGPGNIDADPQFVRAPDPGPIGVWGTETDDYGDLRLLLTSPCIDAALCASVATDLHDLDDDTNVTESVPFDVQGLPRFFDDPAAPNVYFCTADLGAYEAQGVDVGCPWNTVTEYGRESGYVGTADFFDLLQHWGPCFLGAPCPWDTTGDAGVPDGVVDTDDFFALLQHWGACP